MALILQLIAALNILIVVIGLVGNSLVITVVKKTRSMRTTTNFLLVNLAVADIITLLFNPFLHARLWPRNIWSDLICKFLTGNGVVGLPVLVSVFTLVVVAVERYHALVKPLDTGLRLSKENVHYAVMATWVLAVALNIPIVIDYGYDEHEQRCKGLWHLNISDWMSKYTMFFCTVAIASTFVIGYCYFQILRGLYITKTICNAITVNQKERRLKNRKLAKLLVFVTVIFYICHLPFNIFMISMASMREVSGEFVIIIFQALAGIAFTNSSLNPIVYAFQSSSYKSGFKRIFRCQNLGENVNGIPRQQNEEQDI